MSSHDRMHRNNGLPPRHTATIKTAIDLLDARMHGAQAMQSTAKLGRKPAVRLRHVPEQRIAARRRPVEDVQERCPRRLLLEGDVGVPGDGVRAGGEEGCAGCVVGAAVHDVDLWMAPGRAGCLVGVVAAEVGA